MVKKIVSSQKVRGNVEGAKRPTPILGASQNWQAAGEECNRPGRRFTPRGQKERVSPSIEKMHQIRDCFFKFFSFAGEIAEDLNGIFSRFQNKFEENSQQSHPAKFWAAGLIQLTAKGYGLPCDLSRLKRDLKLKDAQIEQSLKTVKRLFDLDLDQACCDQKLLEFWNTLTQNPKATPLDQLIKLQNQIIEANSEHDWKLSLSLYEKMQTFFPEGKYTAIFGRCRSLIHLKQPQQALKVISEAHDSGFHAPELDEIRADTLRRMGREGEAEQTYQQMLAHPEYPPSAHAFAHSGLASINFVRGNLGPAKNHLKQAILLDPFNSEALQWLAEVHRELGEFDEARAIFRQIDNGSPKDLSLFINLAMVEESQGNFVEAITALEEAVSRDKDLLPARRSLVRLYQQLSDDTSELRHREGIISSPVENSQNCPVKIEFFLYEYHRSNSRQKLVQAISLGRKMLETDPNHGETLFLTAIALAEGGDLDGSLEMMRNLMIQDPSQFVHNIEYFSALWQKLNKEKLLKRQQKTLSGVGDEIDIAIRDCLESSK